MSTRVQPWDRFTCRDDESDHNGQTFEVTEIKMSGYLVSSVTGAQRTRMHVHRDGLPGPRWHPAPCPMDLDEAARISVLNEIASNDNDDTEPGTKLWAILDTLDARGIARPSLAYVAHMLASIGATERDGLWSVAELPAGWGWERSATGGMWLRHNGADMIAICGADETWTVRHPGADGDPSHGFALSVDAAIERATWECRRRGLFATEDV